ncbi:unnamed protein product [Adineta steineri]|uniref:Ubiquitin-like protein n=1 Tax=Adineta steineri TaxID=433720 RepID=A0A816E8P9_9BILA|nr:unnamed protein product [Adineta steineri]CAF1645711.1 unnamed protein product [Adineta steineri]
MVEVWFQRDQNAPTKINIDPDLNIDDLKQKIFDATDNEEYQTTYSGKLLIPSVKVPQNTTNEMPIVFTTVVNAPSSEFATPGTCKKLYCKGHPCAKCHKCRDWHFTGDQDQWNRVWNFGNWKIADWYRWICDNYYQLFTKRDDATCRLGDLRGFRSSGFRSIIYHLDISHACLCEKH